MIKVQTISFPGWRWEYNVGLEELLLIKLFIRAQEVLKEVDAMRQYQVNSNQPM